MFLRTPGLSCFVAFVSNLDLLKKCYFIQIRSMCVHLIRLDWLTLFSQHTLGTLGEERNRILRLEINVISKMSARHRWYSKRGSSVTLICFLQGMARHQMP